MNQERLMKFARLAVEVGVNIQHGQMLILNAPVDCKEFARMIVEAAYKAGASYVLVRWTDEQDMKLFFTYASNQVIGEVPNYIVEQYHYLTDNKAAVISISASTPGLLKDIDPLKMQIANKARHEKLGFWQKHLMGNGAQWLVIAYPTESWANKVFGSEDAFNKLFDAILTASRVTDDNDPVAEWKNHLQRMAEHNQKLNRYNFQSLHFHNSLGSDLEVGLVEDHIWSGGGETAKNGVYFVPNIPTEETFTMPHCRKINGRVYATKPLNYQGKLIEDFWLEFKDGKVVDYDAKAEKEALKALLELDEGSSSLGEVALISYDSPISNANILFFNTLFDENASCHLALGNAYPMNMKNAESMTEEELMAKGYNKSMTHVDFMFGSKDMEIIGTTHDGKKIQIFKNGNFVF